MSQPRSLMDGVCELVRRAGGPTLMRVPAPGPGFGIFTDFVAQPGNELLHHRAFGGTRGDQ